LKIEQYPSYEVKKIEQKTFYLHIISQILNGFSFGIFILQEIILKKSLGGSDFEVTLLIFLTSSAFLFSIYGAEIINRSRNQARTIIILGVFSKSFLFLIPLFENPGFFIFCIAAMSYTDSLIKPSWNVVFKHNYTDKKRSSLYSYASIFHVSSLMIVTTVAGYLLDFNYEIYKILYPLSGLLDIIAFINLAKLIGMGQNKAVEDNSSGKIDLKLVKDILILPLRNMMRIFRENKPFFKFEVYFFYYGMAFMILLPAIPIFLVEQLNLDYTPISIAKGLVFHAAMIMATPLMGKLYGSGNPSKFTGVLFLSLVIFPLLLMLISSAGNIWLSTDLLLYITYFIFGISMSGVIISWNISSIYFSPSKMVANYQAVHITLTGIRGIFSPFLGYLVIKYISLEANFILSAILFLLAGIMMIREGKRGNELIFS
jgi:hypothetical protein